MPKSKYENVWSNRVCEYCSKSFKIRTYKLHEKIKERGKFCSIHCARKGRDYSFLNSTGVKKHGMAMTPTYHVWQGMKTRCYNKNFHAYPNYGARGITVCDRWLESFENFYEDMGEKPHKKSLDRIDNSKGYSKENCRWATNEEQQRNRRWARLLTYKGVTKPIAEWAEITGIPYGSIFGRLNKFGNKDFVIDGHKKLRLP